MRYTRKRELIEEKRNPYKEVTTTLGKLAAALGVPASELIEEIKDEDKGDIA